MMSLLNTDLSFTYLLAQSNSSSGSVGGSLIGLLFGLAAYAFSSYCLYVMFQKLNYPNPWFGWVPFLQNWAIFEVGD